MTQATRNIPENVINTLGKVYLVGAGPGAADLITVRGAKLLEQADIVFYDALVDPEMLLLCPQAEQVAVGKRCGQLSSAQQFINKRLVDAAQKPEKYQIIVRLKGGDPMLFGRADEEITALKAASITVEVVPGITAALAGAASLQQSLTLRGISRSVAFVTLAQGAQNTQDSKHPENKQPIVTPAADTMVYYMGRKDATQIAQTLIDQNNAFDINTPAYILEAVSTTNERLWSSTLGNMANGQADSWFDSNSPALILIGEALSQKLQAAQIDQSDNLLQGQSTKVDDGLQNSLSLARRTRRA